MFRFADVTGCGRASRASPWLRRVAANATHVSHLKGGTPNGGTIWTPCRNYPIDLYLGNESGAKLARPELFRMPADAHPGDVLLVEQVDRLSRLGTADRFKVELAARKVRV